MAKTKGKVKEPKTEQKEIVPVETEIILEGELNPRQELFCELWASHREFFGNGTQAYIEAYDIVIKKPADYLNAKSNASRLLSEPRILQRINQIMTEVSLNDEFVDKQHAFLITQNVDFKTKLGAIKLYKEEHDKIQKKLEEAKAQFIQNNVTINNNGPQNNFYGPDVIEYVTKALLKPVKQPEAKK